MNTALTVVVGLPLETIHALAIENWQSLSMQRLNKPSQFPSYFSAVDLLVLLKQDEILGKIKLNQHQPIDCNDNESLAISNELEALQTNLSRRNKNGSATNLTTSLNDEKSLFHHRKKLLLCISLILKCRSAHVDMSEFRQQCLIHINQCLTHTIAEPNDTDTKEKRRDQMFWELFHYFLELSTPEQQQIYQFFIELANRACEKNFSDPQQMPTETLLLLTQSLTKSLREKVSKNQKGSSYLLDYLVCNLVNRAKDFSPSHIQQWHYCQLAIQQLEFSSWLWKTGLRIKL